MVEWILCPVSVWKMLSENEYRNGISPTRILFAGVFFQHVETTRFLPSHPSRPKEETLESTANSLHLSHSIKVNQQI